MALVPLPAGAAADLQASSYSLRTFPPSYSLAGTLNVEQKKDA